MTTSPTDIIHCDRRSSERRLCDDWVNSRSSAYRTRLCVAPWIHGFMPRCRPQRWLTSLSAPLTTRRSMTDTSALRQSQHGDDLQLRPASCTPRLTGNRTRWK